MTLTDKDAQRRPWCMFGTSTNKLFSPARLVYVDDGLINKYVSEHGARWPHCRECTPEELAPTGLSQPPKPWADRVTQWAIDRNIIGGTTPKDQFGKLVEEVKELRDAIEEYDLPDIVDAIGDCSVVLAIIAAQCGLAFEQCQEAAWEEIKDRKGRIINGTFVKEVSE
jgi:NTP pyrophosphatase (non-canonical NTP hydrolase)